MFAYILNVGEIQSERVCGRGGYKITDFGGAAE